MLSHVGQISASLPLSTRSLIGVTVTVADLDATHAAVPR